MRGSKPTEKATEGTRCRDASVEGGSGLAPGILMASVDAVTDRNEPSVEVFVGKSLVLGQSRQELEVRRRPHNLIFTERLPQSLESFPAIRSVDDQLGDQGIVKDLLGVKWRLQLSLPSRDCARLTLISSPASNPVSSRTYPDSFGVLT